MNDRGIEKMNCKKKVINWEQVAGAIIALVTKEG